MKVNYNTDSVAGWQRADQRPVFPPQINLPLTSDGLERTARQHQRYGSVNLLFQT